ncbi:MULTISPECIES: citrate lyase acyl carrier protein [unclassified Oceanispirochaeta]|uniref:citrate lyase acyl carrier protein n=1 Tax=unclassified Oceanispirochaeta TaxID=2635722 RepID=UPI000E094178|nr:MULTISPECIES: citrate lyase acyl carrier protein [unclassified Oceanispirochaeta]MBF9015326.1 citrate lyase acyl carrier protein [Oceanispirochaeta sp. M2]NPD71784.1 citrate lyase acyl carrier protein [Oceanispirochaeta sp. M1]RDG32974.1 citrate lyase acyl carrier protein [Oceanispirochaeta sp. M1]
MKIMKTGLAGSLESSDVLITVDSNNGNGRDISLDSTVKRQYGKQILKVVDETLDRLSIVDVKIRLEDKGALDCTIRARLEAAVYRAVGSATYPWEKLS